MSPRLFLILPLLFIFCAGCQKEEKPPGERYTLPNGDASAVFWAKPTETTSTISFQFSFKNQMTGLLLDLAPPDSDGEAKILSTEEAGTLDFDPNSTIMSIQSIKPTGELPEGELEKQRLTIAGADQLFSNFETDQGLVWKFFKRSESVRGHVFNEAVFTYVTDQSLVIAIFRGPYKESVLLDFGRSLRIGQ